MKKVTIAILVAMALVVGILIGYALKPFDLFKCFEELNFQNITCYKTGNQYNCITSDNKGYVIEHAYNK